MCQSLGHALPHILQTSMHVFSTHHIVMWHVPFQTGIDVGGGGCGSVHVQSMHHYQQRLFVAADMCHDSCRTCMASLTAVLRLTWLRCHSTSDLLVCPSRANLYSCRVYLSVYKLMIQLVLMFRLPIAILHLVPCQGKGPATVPCVLVGCSFSYAGMYGIGHPCSIYICIYTCQ